MEKRSEKFYKRFLKAADGYLERNELEDAERNFANALRQVYNHSQSKLYEIAAALRGLAFVYKARGSVNKRGEDIVKATGLFVASLTRLQEYSKNELNGITDGITAEIVHLQDEIETVHEVFINETLRSQQDGQTDDYQRVEHYRETLHQIRENCQLRISKLDKLPSLDPTKRDISVEKERAEHTQRVYSETAKSMKELVTSMVDDCIQVMSSPPCRYSVVGLGSTAREEATPYSDLEFCILVEKDTEDVLKYFTNLTNFLHLKVVELGETILPSLGIQSLNNFYSGSSEDDWFFDEGRRGFSFDGTMPWASKIPTGRNKTMGKPWVQSLIKTPQDMASLLSETSICNEGYHLADVLSTCALLCGDQSLFEDYGLCKREKLLQSEDATSDPSDPHCPRSGEGGNLEEMSPWKQRILQELLEVERQYHTSLANYVRKPGSAYAVKKDFYRFPSLVVEYLGKYFNIESSSSWTTIAMLESGKYLSLDGAHNLRVVLGIAGELRLRAYLDNESQSEYFNDFLTLVARKDAPENIAKLLARYFFTVVSLEEAIKKVSEVGNLSHLKDSVLYDDNPKIKAQMYLQFRQYYKAKDILEDMFAEKLRLSPNKHMDQDLAEVCKYLGNCFFFLENIPEAVKYHRIALDINEKIYNCHPVLRKLKAVGDSNLNYGSGLCELRENKKALPYLKKALEVRLFLLEQSSTAVERVICLQDVVDAQTNLSKVYSSSSTSADAVIFFYHNKQALNTCETLLQKYNFAYPHYPSLYFDQGLMYYKLRRFQESAEAYQKALELSYEHKKHELLLHGLLNNLGNAVLELGDFDMARSLHSRAYEIRSQIHGGKDHNSLARSLNNFGLISEKTRDFKEAHEFYTLARDMSIRINGADSSYEHLQMYKRNVSRVAEKLTD